MQRLWEPTILSGNSWGPREGDAGAVRALLWDGQHLSGERKIITVDEAHWEAMNQNAHIANDDKNTVW